MLSSIYGGIYNTLIFLPIYQILGSLAFEQNPQHIFQLPYLLSIKGGSA